MIQPTPFPLPGPGSERNEEEALRGFLRIRIGGSVRQVPTLKMRHSSEWTEKCAKLIAETKLDDTVEPMTFITSLASVAGDVMLDMVLLYDRSGALGGREQLLDNADPRDIYQALESMATATFPFVTDPRVHSVVEGFGPQIRLLLLLALERLAARSSQASDTSSLSSGGDSTPTPSTTGSATSSSSSSGPTARSASCARRRSSGS